MTWQVFRCSHASEYCCNFWRVLVSRFNRTNAFCKEEIPPMVVKLTDELVSVLGTGKKFYCSFAPWLHNKGFDKTRFLLVHAFSLYAVNWITVEIRRVHSEPRFSGGPLLAWSGIRPSSFRLAHFSEAAVDRGRMPGRYSPPGGAARRTSGCSI